MNSNPERAAWDHPRLAQMASRLILIGIAWMFIVLPPSARAEDNPIAADGQLGIGNGHVCAISSNRNIVCWGIRNNFNQSIPPAGRFLQMSAYGDHSCGVQTDGTLKCWGNNDNNQLTVPAGNYVQVIAGAGFNCALGGDGKAACWGLMGTQPATPPTDVFRQLATGSKHACGLKSDGYVKCWGDNIYQQANPPTEAFSQISARLNRTCGLLAVGGTVKCWGDSPGSPPPSGTFTMISVGTLHACGLRSSGAIECWGQDTAGETQAAAGPYSQVVAGVQLTCGITISGAVSCWGYDDPATLRKAVPTNLSLARRSLASGADYSCEIYGAKPVSCWGGTSQTFISGTSPGSSRQITASATFPCTLRNTTGLANTIVCAGMSGYITNQIGNAPELRQVSAGSDFLCGLGTDGVANCWGNNGDNQWLPGGGYLQLSTGARHSCGLLFNGGIYCAGGNDRGQSFPYKNLLKPTNFRYVTSGDLHGCAIQDNGSAFCWGSISTAPVGVFRQISGGADFTCGIKVNGTLACWGKTTVSGLLTPPSGTYVELSAGADHACAVASDGTVACWGSNTFAQAPKSSVGPAALPNGAIGTNYSATLTMAVTNATSAASGYAYTPVTPSFAVTGGTLPVGIRLNGATLSGTPSTAGTYSFTIRAMDQNGMVAYRTYGVSIR